MVSNQAGPARAYHEETKHTAARLREMPHTLEWDNMPVPVKHYPDLEPIPLPDGLPESTAPAWSVLEGSHRPEPAGLDVGELARLLVFSAGVTRRARMGDGRPVFFRAAPSAGALYPIEVYVVCGDLPGLDAGVYHFGPVEFALRRLRAGDHRAALAEAAASSEVTDAGASLVLTGIPWRTTWKYRERGYRHLFWDSGTILGNLLTVAAGTGIEPRVLTAFVDDEVSRLLGLGDPEEYPLEVVPLRGPVVGAAGAGGGARGVGGEAGGVPAVDDLAHRVHPLSPRPRSHELVARTHRAGFLGTTDAVEAWRDEARQFGDPAAGHAADVVADPPGGATGVEQGDREAERGADPPDTIEDVVLRRGSTRRYSREPVAHDALGRMLAAAARPVPGDCTGADRTLLSHFVAVHAVDGVDPGAYRYGHSGLELVRAGDVRREVAHLCLDQPLGGDAAFVVAHCADLDAVLGALGPRGYRAAQLEAGVVSGRLHLAAYALGYGASGITFYDDEVSEFFGTAAAPMLLTTVGVPAYRSRPGKRPEEMDRLRIALT